MIRYAVIGTSGITAQFVAAARQTGRFVLAGVCSRTRESGAMFAAQHGCDRVLVGTGALAACDDIDAVYIASPNALHAAQTEQMLRTGKHVLCEKPATVTVEESRRLGALADENHLVYMEALMGRYLPERQRILDVLPSLGRISYARLEFSQLSGRYDAYLRGESVNIFDPALAAGGLMDLGIYCVYPALELFGQPTAMHTRATLLRTGADGSGVSLWEYPDKLVELVWNKTGQQRAASTIIGDNGTLTVELISLLTNAQVHWRDGRVETLSEPRDKVTAMAYEGAAFADCIGYRGEDYVAAAALRIAVSDAMEKMRRDAGLKF